MLQVNMFHGERRIQSDLERVLKNKVFKMLKHFYLEQRKKQNNDWLYLWTNMKQFTLESFNFYTLLR